MSILEYLAIMGIINFLMMFISEGVFILTGLIGVALRVPVYGRSFRVSTFLANALNVYLLASLTALLTLSAIQARQSVVLVLFFSIVGGIAILWATTKPIYEKMESGVYQEKQAAKERSYQAGDHALLSICSIVFFVLSLVIPAIAVNPFSTWLLRGVGTMYELPVIGWILFFGGAAMMLAMMKDLIVIIPLLTAAAVAALAGKTKRLIVRR